MASSAQDHGYQEIPHTADWAMKVWAGDLPSLFMEAARGMNALVGARLGHGPAVLRHFDQQAGDPESLLVAFLSELVYLQEQENLGFTEFELQLDDVHLSAEMHGAPLEALEKPIKAVTYHNLKIRKGSRGYEVEVVFDV
jgi:SHS2 domain-containing protein